MTRPLYRFAAMRGGANIIGFEQQRGDSIALALVISTKPQGRDGQKSISGQKRSFLTRYIGKKYSTVTRKMQEKV